MHSQVNEQKLSQSQLKPAMIIPAAGWGRRMGSVESKEMLLDSRGEPLIKWSLDLAQALSLRAVVISRPEKKSLNQYLLERKDCELVLISKTREWPDSVLQSQNYWSDYNLLLLPDTRFEPLEILQFIIEDLNKGFQLSLGTHFVSDASTWGCVIPGENNTLICEKPKESKSFLAWGVLGFTKQFGKKLFQDFLIEKNQHKWISYSVPTRHYQFTVFKDLTR